MDSSQHYEYQESSSEESYSGSDEDNHLKKYKKDDIEKRFQINEGMMYLTSCNINQDIIPLTLHGTLDTSGKCICYVGGSSDSPGTLLLNNHYDVYCDFFSYKSVSADHQHCIGNVIIINIDEINCNNFNPDILDAGKGITQCPSKLLIPITTANSVAAYTIRNSINTDTIYITSILPTKIKQLTLTFTTLDITGGGLAIQDGSRFILQLIFKKMDNTKNTFLEEKGKQNIIIK